MINNAYYYSQMDKSNGYTKLLDIAYEAADKYELGKKLTRADKVIGIMLKLIEGYKGLPVVQEGHYQKWSEILITAGYLYFIFYDEKHPYSSLMLAREACAGKCKDIISPGELEFIFQAVEACGGNTGIQKLKPAPDTPHEMLVLAVWIEANSKELFSLEV